VGFAVSLYVCLRTFYIHAGLFKLVIGIAAYIFLILYETVSYSRVFRPCYLVGVPRFHSLVFSRPWVRRYMHNINFYPRDAMLARVIAIETCPSVRLSVRPSVTRLYCVKTKKASAMISSPSGSPMILVFCCQISLQNSKGFPTSGGVKKGWGGKIQRFSSFKRQYLENGSGYSQSYY